MLAILNSLNAHNLPIFQPILMIPASKFMVHRALSDKAYLSLGLLSPLREVNSPIETVLAVITNDNDALHVDFSTSLILQQWRKKQIENLQAN